MGPSLTRRRRERVTRRLSQDTALRVGFLILKHGSGDGDLRATLVTLGRAALALGFDELVALVRYVAGEPGAHDSRILKEALMEIVPGDEHHVMSKAGREMLAQAYEEAKAEGKVEGIAEGRAKGRAEGMAEGIAEGRTEGERLGLAAALMRLLTRRFGEVPEPVRTRIDAAGITELDGWLDAAIDAPSLHSVFDTH